MNYDKWKDAKWLPYTIAACSGVLLYYILQHLSLVGSLVSGIWKVLSPLILSVILAYMMDPLVLFYENRVISKFIKPWHPSSRRKVSIALTVLTLMLVVVLFLLALIPQLVGSVVYLFENLGENIYSLELQINQFTQSLGANGIDLNRVNEALMTALEKISGIISNGSILNHTQSFGSTISTFLVAFIVGIYLLLEKKPLVHTVQSFMKRILSQDGYVEVAVFCSRCHNILTRYITCTLLEALVVACVNGLFMLIFRMPYAMVVSVVVGVTNLAPTFGPIVGCVIGMFILLLARPIYALYFLVFTLVLQTIDGYVIKPRLFGNSLGVSPLLILISIVIGGQLFGVMGILLAIPFSAILQSAVTDYIFPYTRDNMTDASAQKDEAVASHMNAQMRRERNARSAENADDVEEFHGPSAISRLTDAADDFFETITVKKKKKHRRKPVNKED